LKKSIITLAIIILFSIEIYAIYPINIASLSFIGNNSISASKIKSVIPIKSPNYLTKVKDKIPFVTTDKIYFYETDMINAVNAIINLYQKNGFLHATVSYKTTKKNNAYHVEFHIIENNQTYIETVQVKTESNYADSVIYSRNPQKWENIKYTDDKFYEIKSNIEQILLENSYIMSKIDYSFDLNKDSTRVKINFNINEGAQFEIDSIRLNGLEMLNQKTVLNQIPLKKNQMYHPYLIDFYTFQLAQLTHFKSINVDVIPMPESANLAQISFRLNEQRKHQFKSGIGYGIEDKIRAFIEYNQYNFLGNARHLQLNIKTSVIEPWNINLKTREPLPFRHSTYGSVNPFWIKQKEDIYELQRKGFILGYSQNLSITNNYQLYYLFERIHLYTADVFDTDQLQSLYNKSSVYLTYSSNYVKKEKGFSNTISLLRSGVGFNSTYHFFRALNTFNYYYPITQSNSFAFQMKYGHLLSFDKDKIVPIEERYYSGGANSIRGWARNQISPINENKEKTGGNRLIEFSIENRKIIFKDLEFALFYDIGNVWETKVDTSNLLSSVGFGLRYYSILGPIRLDFARPLDIDRWQFYLQLGQSF